MQSEYFTFIILFTVGHCDMEGYIVGGSYTSITNHPHSVFLSIDCVTKYNVMSHWICGASIVNQRILITAGHCLDTCTKSSHVNIIVGHENKERGSIYTAYSYMVHEDYNAKTSSCDIGLVKVANQLRLDSTISRVALMRKPPYYEKAIVAGWGMTDDVHKKSSDRLKYVSQLVWQPEECLRLLKEKPDGTICASSEKTEDYAAQGDSGSALVVRGYIQIGIVSYKVPHKAKNVIIYTDVGYYYNWIKSNAMRIYCTK